MSVSLLLMISPFKATSDCVPESALHFLSVFVRIGLALEDCGNLNMAVVGWAYCCASITILRQLSVLCPFSHAWRKEVTRRREVIFSEFLRLSVMSEVSKRRVL